MYVIKIAIRYDKFIVSETVAVFFHSRSSNSGHFRVRLKIAIKFTRM